MNSELAADVSKAFGLAFSRCQEQRSLSGGQWEMLLVPSVVCIAFAVEIGLKAIILKEGGAKVGHSLTKLFEALREDTRGAIIKTMGMTEATFGASLQGANEAFVEWRYVYERDSAHVDVFFLSNLHQAVQALLVERAR